MSFWETLKEFFTYFKTPKRRWLLPIIIFLVIIGILMVASSQSVFAPFIYTLF